MAHAISKWLKVAQLQAAHAQMQAPVPEAPSPNLGLPGAAQLLRDSPHANGTLSLEPYWHGLWSFEAVQIGACLFACLHNLVDI